MGGTQYGPENPHPLSQMKTELVWEGKYDEWGRRREVDVAGCAMPLQKIETVDQPRFEAAAAGQLELFEKKSKRLDDFRNMLIWGDNKLVMASLLRDFKGKIDLIYIDPPFDVGADFSMKVDIGDERDSLTKEQSTLEMVAYRDTWGRGTDSYLHMMYERLGLMRGLLSPAGSIVVHTDYRVCSHIRLLLDEVFGRELMRNEIIWNKGFRGTRAQGQFQHAHDTLWWFTAGEHYVWNQTFEPYKDDELSRYNKIDEDGRRYALIKRRRTDGSVYYGRTYPGEEGKWRNDVISDVPVMAATSSERLGYETQKPEALIEVLVRALSPDDGLVADFFCGSGTTGAVAERLGRRWIMCDLGRFAIHTARKRLIDLQRELHAAGKPYRAFDVYNLGRYERQWWQREYLEGADEEHRRVVLEFFRAEILDSAQAPSPLIHGRKNRAFCHVDGIDSVFTRDEAKGVARAAAEAGAKECYCLAWEFEMDLGQTVAALQAEYGVRLKLVQIPREIMERNRKNPPPFLEVAVLEAEPVYRKLNGRRAVDIKLTKFLPSLAEVPSKELEAVKERAMKSGFDFIDFWAVDFDWRPGKPFAHHWQDYRTRKDRTLKTVSDAGYRYPKRGKYTACVKVVDTFGCDTSITVEVRV